MDSTADDRPPDWVAGVRAVVRLPAGCKTAEQESHLLHLLGAIENGDAGGTRRLLEGMDPNLRLGVEGEATEPLLEWRRRQFSPSRGQSAGPPRIVSDAVEVLARGGPGASLRYAVGLEGAMDLSCGGSCRFRSTAGHWVHGNCGEAVAPRYFEHALLMAARGSPGVGQSGAPDALVRRLP